jgi:ABC-type antimicrobial peptide transport system permease subunit
MTPLAVGLALGLVASLGATRLLASTLAHVSPLDPLAFGGAIAVLVAAGTLGCWLPARRAISVDPVVVLRR